MVEIMEVIMETYKAEKFWILNYPILASILASIPACVFLQKDFQRNMMLYEVEQ
jgi:hypothetical protein